MNNCVIMIQVKVISNGFWVRKFVSPFCYKILILYVTIIVMLKF